METKILLIRHGETLWNREFRKQGQRDVPLSDLGREQAAKLAGYLKDETFSAIYASDLSRAKETAQLVAKPHRLPVTVFPEFRERNFGEWEGLMDEEVKRKYPDWKEVTLNGGKYGVETVKAMQKRFSEKCEELAREHFGGQIAIVAHGLCIHMFLHAVTGGEYGPQREKSKNTSMTRLIYHQNGRWTVESYNEVQHLQ